MTKIEIEQIKKNEFKKKLRNELTNYLESIGYNKIYDNELNDQNDSKRWIFCLRFKGNDLIEICNSDWRDYTEYFELKINNKEIIQINILEYSDLNNAYAILHEQIKTNLTTAST